MSRPVSCAPDDRPALLLITTGPRLYREYLLRSIATRYRIHLFLPADPTWEQEYATGWTVLENTHDAHALCVAARELHARWPVEGVLCWDEALILQTAGVAAALGLPGGDPDMILRCRDKHLTRTALAAGAVPQPQSVLVSSVEQALATGEQIGYPVVLKPRALAASLGVVKVHTPAELEAQFAFARDTTVPGAPRYDAPVLVEEYADGPEISIDCAVSGGLVWPMFVARKTVGYAPYFEEIGHTVDAADPLLLDPQIDAILRATHRALGFSDGMTHVELKLSARGPKVIEVNARLGGDLIPYLGMRASGIDPGLAAAAVACGRVPDVRAHRTLVAGVRFFYVDEDDTVVEDVRFDGTRLPPAIDVAVATAAIGATVSPPPKGTLWGRIAYAAVVTETTSETGTALDAAEAALRLTNGRRSGHGGSGGMTRYAVIVDPVATGQDYPQAFREAGCAPIAVLSAAEPFAASTWHPEHFDHVHVFAGDLDGLASELRAYEPRYLVPGAETGVELADALVELVAPGSGNRHDLGAARRDKWAMARALAGAGVPHLRQLCTDDPAQIANWLRQTGLESAPIVLKPPRSAGGDNVHLVPAAADWRPAFDAILGSVNALKETNAAVLVSEYAEGTELLVDTYSVDGRHGLVDVCRYTKRQFEDRIGIYDCVEFLAPDDPDVQAVWPYTRQVLDAVGVRNGCGHTEVMLTPRGPRLIEIGSRPAGGGHQHICEVATGDNHIKRTVAHRARGEFKPGYELVKHLRAVFVSAPRAGVWRNAEILDGVTSLSSYQAQHRPYRTGDRVPATRDIFSLLACVILASTDADVLGADHRQIKAWEAQLDIR